jgi:phenylpropionate dioxygenase-like ring-hydroxylating dioxygenase large terminal subunit
MQISADIKPLKERDGQLINNWYVACLAKDLRAAKPITSVIYDEKIVLFRDSNGLPVALEDRCAHRHAQLSQGRVCDGKIQCPYHGWTFNSAGECTHVPSEGDAKSERTRGSVRSYPVIEQDECIWVWMGKEVPKDPPSFRFPNFENKNGWSHYFMETWFDNEVTNLAENFMDVPHTVFVHAGWFRTAAFKQVPIKVESTETQTLVTYQRADDDIGFTSLILNPKRKPMTHTDLFIMPNLTRVDYGFGDRGFIIISQITPVSTLRSKVYTAIIFKMGAANFLLKPFFKFYTRQVIEQDVVIMRNQGENLARNFRTDFGTTDADVVHVAIEKLRHGGLTGKAPPPRPPVEKTIWI